MSSDAMKYVSSVCTHVCLSALHLTSVYLLKGCDSLSFDQCHLSEISRKKMHFWIQKSLKNSYLDDADFLISLLASCPYLVHSSCDSMLSPELLRELKT